VVVQPALTGWPTPGLRHVVFVAGAIEILALPFVLLARRQRAPSDRIDDEAKTAARGAGIA
jgi:hypothetical protein